MKTLQVLSVILVAILGGSLVYNFVQYSDIQAKNTTISSQATLIQTQQNTMTSLSNDLNSTRATLNQKLSEIATLNLRIADMQTQIETYRNTVDLLQAQVESLNSEVSTLNGQITNLQSKIDALSNPRDFKSTEELLDFLDRDNTDEQRYIPDTHDCDDFARDLQIAAFREGFKMYIVPVHEGVLWHRDFYDGTYYLVTYYAVWYGNYEEYWLFGDHTMNLCWINNIGWVLVEPQNDGIYILYQTEL